MNKLIVEPKNRHFIRVVALNRKDETPKDKKEQILWCQDLFENLRKNGKSLYGSYNKRKGFSIVVIKYEDYTYLIVALRNEFGTYNDNIYIFNSEKDCLNIALWYKKNIEKPINIEIIKEKMKEVEE